MKKKDKAVLCLNAAQFVATNALIVAIAGSSGNYGSLGVLILANVFFACYVRCL